VKRILSLLIIIAFLGPGFTPLAQAIGTGGLHYCKHSSGPCKHGDACPVKHRSHKKGEKGHHKKGNYFLECSTSGNTLNLSAAPQMPCLTTSESFYTTEIFGPFLLKVRLLYNEPFPDPPERPPATV
jgi:hypothetical protein